MSREIKLTRGLLATVDDQDYDRTLTHTWRASRDQNGNWLINAQTYDGLAVQLGRFLFEPPPHLFVWHSNHDPFDFRRSTVRLLTRSQVSLAAAMPIDSTTGIKGVSRAHGRYKARICVGKRR